MTRTKKCNRKQLLRIVATMVDEFETRAGDPAPTDPATGLAYLRTAAHLRELLSIAQGRRSATYWTRKDAQGSRHQPLRTRSQRWPWRHWLRPKSRGVYADAPLVSLAS